MPQSTTVNAYLSLGSNLGEREAALESAVDEITKIPTTAVTARSRTYTSKPWGKDDQPDYLNLVLEIATRLDPHKLLHHLQHIETALGRERASEERWGPRVIDIDLLLYGDRTLRTPSLQVPHPRMWERRFVLAPLAEIASHLRTPEGAALNSLLSDPEIAKQIVEPHVTERSEADATAG
jgi:2-amino-4-hydroxy-6-hydroxymethyldihydropteridine diphosphokinase